MEKEQRQKLLEGCTPEERAARIGRLAILEEMGFFGDRTNIALAKNEGPGTWTARVRRRFSGIYGNTEGCEAADLEVAAEMLGVFDDVYDIEAIASKQEIQDAEDGA